jgi:hypothetical protein
MSGDARDFNIIKKRAGLKYFLQGKMPKKIHAIPTETSEEHAPSYASIKNWVVHFTCGGVSTWDVPRSG